MERVNDSAVVLLPLNSIETEAQQQILNTARRLAGALTKRGRTAALLRLIGELVVAAAHMTSAMERGLYRRSVD